MTLTDLIVISPLIILTASIIMLLLMIAFYRRHRLIFGLTLVGLAGTLASLPLAVSRSPRQVTSLLIVDGYTLFFMGVLVAASIVVTLLAYGYLTQRPGNHEEFYLLLLSATLGVAVLTASSHIVSFFLGLEILSISLYTLIAYPRTIARSIEAGLKYLVMAAVSASFLLFGLALVYADLGTMELAQIASLLTTATANQNLLLVTGLALMTIGIAFKLALVPFHMWTPDIYEGAPAPVSALVATVSKGGVFAFLLRYFGQLDSRTTPALYLIFVVMAAVSMLGGNWLALRQDNVKRLLAYSSIAHLGYALVALLAGGGLAVTAASYYVVAYLITMLTAFGVVTVLSNSRQEPELREDYRALFWQRPWLAVIFTTALFSLAGLPLTAGFIGKFYLVVAGAGSALWTLILILIISSTIGLYYYLRLIIVMALPPQPETAQGATLPALSVAGSLTLAGLLLLLVWFGVYPAPLIELIQATVAGLS